LIFLKDNLGENSILELDMKYIKLEEVTDFEGLIDKTIKVLKSGGVVLMPSDTCYGFLTDITHEHGVEKLAKLKQRKEDKSFSLCVADKQMLEEYVDLDEVAREISEIYMPGLITLVVLEKDSVKNFLGMRIPDHNLMLSVAKGLGNAFYTTSANISGEEAPYAIEQIKEQLGADFTKIDLVLDAGVLDYTDPSTVVIVDDNRVEILREGDLAAEIKVNYDIK